MTAPKLPSDRSFGLLFTLVFGLIGAWLAWKSSPRWDIFLALAALFLLAALAVPRILRPLNALWMRFGTLLNRIVSPIVLGVIYFGMITPMALIMRIRGRDVLHRSFDAAAGSYWVQREPPGPDAKQSFPRQF